jgi:hypothetical protein
MALDGDATVQSLADITERVHVNSDPAAEQ